MKQFFKFFFASMFGVIAAGFLSIAILVGIIAVASSSGKDEKPIKDKSVLYMSLDEGIGDRTNRNPFEDFNFEDFSTDPKIGLNDILANFKKAAEDERIKGVFVDLSMVNVGMARMNEIRNAMKEFKESGKFIHAYGDILDQNAYYIATVSDKIYLNPGGLMILNGLSSQRMFFKGTLEKLEIDMQVIRHGKYKSAVEPFFRENMSDENRLQTEAFVGSLWNVMASEMAEARNLTPAQINQFCNGLEVRDPEAAEKLGLIDGVKYRDEVIEEMKSMLEIEEDEDLAFVKMVKYMDAKSPNKEEKKLEDYKNKIAVVYASGDIILGESDDGSMGSKTIAKAIRQARENEHVKAVVLRVNSPGGSSLASDIIWREVELTKKEKPVVVSMGNLAASGGYYISCGANKIIADDNTITGSIGVFGVVPNLGRMLKNKLGITIDTVNTNTYSDFGSGFRKMKVAEEVYIRDMIERIYDDFVTKVSEGRSMTYAEVDSIAQGRVWSGKDALEIGLVDEIGGLERAMEVARELGEVESDEVIEYPEQKDNPFENLMVEFSSEMESKMARKYFGSHFDKFNSVYQNITEGGIFMRMPFDISFE